MIHHNSSIADSSSSSPVLLHRGTKRNRAAQILTDSQSSSMAIETHLTDPTLQSLSVSLDPFSLLISQNLTHDVVLQIPDEKNLAFQRGKNYDAYSVLRENKLRDRIRKYHHSNHCPDQDHHVSQIPLPPPPKKQVKFQVAVREKPRGKSSNSSSVLAQSVPDFSSMLRKENRKPPPPAMTLTPPGKRINNGIGMSTTNLSGSKSASSVNEKKGVLTRKSYASLEELKGFSKGVGSAIMAESRGGTVGRNGGRSGKTILGSRQF